MDGVKPHYVRIAAGDRLPSIRQYAPFKAVLIIDSDFSTDWQSQISNWLVESGCRYMMAWGPNCSTWDDSVDWADLQARRFHEDDSKFVMTTWHDKETLESVFWYAQFCAGFSYDHAELKETVLIDVSLADHEAAYLSLWEQSKTLADRDTDEN